LVVRVDLGDRRLRLGVRAREGLLLVVPEPERQGQHRERGDHQQQQRVDPRVPVHRATASGAASAVARPARVTSTPSRVSSPLLYCTSSRITSTVSSPSLTASGICATAKTEPNVPGAPGTP